MQKKRKRILLKIGTNTLTKETRNISRGKIEDIGIQIMFLRDKYEFVIVTSGAIAAAQQFVKLESNGKEITVKQALAAIRQPHLMRIFHESFHDLGLNTSQCLLSYSDFEKEQSKVNIVNTINVLLANDYIPIINENDTVATDEIQFGDNDKLAALTAQLVQADLLVIATNTHGIYTAESMVSGKPKTILKVENLDALTHQLGDTKSSGGTGGMKSKVEAAAIAQKAGIETWIVNGLEDLFLEKAMRGESDFTRIMRNDEF